MLGGKILGGIVLLVLLTVQAVAGEPTYGVELTFSNHILADAVYGTVGDEVTGSPENRAARNRWKQVMEDICEQRGDCEVQTGFKDKYGESYFRVAFFRGTKEIFWYEVTLDPYCLEIKTRPSTFQEYEDNYKIIDGMIFKTAQRLGLEPKFGGGHVHIGAESAFGFDGLLLRNFIVDCYRHPELASGAMENDPANAPPIQRLPVENQRRLAALIDRYDRKEFNIHELLELIQNEVYVGEHKTTKERYDLAKYVAINFTRYVNPKVLRHAKTIEMRAVATHRTAREMIAVLRLFDKRIKILKTQRRPLPFINPGKTTLETDAALFWHYIEETGLDPMDYLFLLKPRWQKKFIDLHAFSCVKRVLSL